MTKIGYARVSTSEQEINLQLDALKAEGCLEKNIFIDKVSGSKKERLGLTKALSILGFLNHSVQTVRFGYFSKTFFP